MIDTNKTHQLDRENKVIYNFLNTGNCVGNKNSQNDHGGEVTHFPPTNAGEARVRDSDRVLIQNIGREGGSSPTNFGCEICHYSKKA